MVHELQSTQHPSSRVGFWVHKIFFFLREWMLGGSMGGGGWIKVQATLSLGRFTHISLLAGLSRTGASRRGDLVLRDPEPTKKRVQTQGTPGV